MALEVSEIAEQQQVVQKESEPKRGRVWYVCLGQFAKQL